MEEDLVAHLLAAAGLTALVGQRINWNVRAQGQALPAVVLQVVSAPRDYTLQTRDSVARYLVQVDCWAGSYGGAKGVARQVVAAMDALAGVVRFQGGFLENERDSFEQGDGPQGAGPTDFHRVSLDYRVVHTES